MKPVERPTSEPNSLSPLDETPGLCLGCSACVTACPVTAADGRFAGPKTLGPAFFRRLAGGWPGQPDLGPEQALSLGADLCLQCHQCDLACPAGLPVSWFVRQAKALAVAGEAGGRGPLARSLERLVTDQERFGSLAARTRRLRRLAYTLSPKLARAAEATVLSVLGLSPARRLPPPPPVTLSRWLASTRRPQDERDRPPVILFAGCHARFYDPGVGRAAVTVLRAAGYRVLLPDQVCCGSPALGRGRLDQAARAAAANLRLLTQASRSSRGPVPVVSPCPSCTLALRRDLPRLTRAPEARELAGRVWDLGEFLDGPARASLDRALRPSGPEPKGAWAYHMPCHLRALGTGRVFPGLLEHYGLGRPLDPGPAADGCCGMAGLAGLRREGYERSLTVGSPALGAYRRLARPAGATAPDAPPEPTVLSDCPACRWQIAEATGLPTAHPVEWLADALRPATPPSR